jgi:serine protease Do
MFEVRCMKKFPVLLAVLYLISGWCPAFGFPAVEVYKKTSRSVVLIVSSSGRGESLVGAGSVVAERGTVVTNAHVVVNERIGEPYPKIQVYVKPDVVTGSLGRDLIHRYGAVVRAYDDDLDLAVIEVRGFPRDIGVMELSDPREIMVGEEVVAIGHPEQGGLWTLTYGRISGEIADQSNIKGKDVFQTDTSLNRGNSGGPLLDGRGYMVGVNANIARIGEGDIPITGVNFAIKSSVLKRWLAEEGIALAYGREPLYPVPVGAGTKPPADVKPPEVEAEKPVVKPAGEEAEASGAPEETVEAPPEAGVLEKETLLREPGPDMREEGGTEEERMLTPRNPYSFDELFKEVEKEMEDLMEEMRQKIRR